MRIALMLVLLCPLFSNAASAWWNAEWTKKLPVTVTVPTANSADKSSVDNKVDDAIVLIKLHSGNFPDFFVLKENLADLRFVANDDKTPLKFHVDSFDLINQLLFVWVRVPNATPGTATKIFMYYGNEKAVAAADAPGTFSTAQSAVFHFAAKVATPTDSTAYNAPAVLEGGEIIPAAVIGAGLKLNGQDRFMIQDAPSNRFDSSTGFTFSAWIKPTKLDKLTSIFSRADSNNNISLAIDTSGLTLQLQRAGKAQKIDAKAAIEMNKWLHVAISVDGKNANIYLNGDLIKSEASTPITITGPLSIGGKSEIAIAFSGEVDEIQLQQLPASSVAIRTAAKNQGMIDEVAKIETPEEAGSKESEDSGLFMVIVKNVDSVGWVVMSIMMVMSLITWLVMIGKGIYLMRVRADNKAFLAEYAKLIETDPAQLDKEDDPIDSSLDDAPVTQAIFGKHDHYQSSPIYRLYHRGIFEVRSRSKTIMEGGLTPRSNNAIRATLDAQTIREAQRLQSQMILLTIAISGGPFIGLFGTVMGVMMTFAGIAKTGDVNIAAIAPGVAAALLTTLGGLTVAIPALFGFNYLSSHIKEYIADMRVFCDEFSTRLAEYYGRT